jgi:hypothetical protein
MKFSTFKLTQNVSKKTYYVKINGEWLIKSLNSFNANLYPFFILRFATSYTLIHFSAVKEIAAE